MREFKLGPDKPSPRPKFDGLPFEEWGSAKFHGIIEADKRLWGPFWEYYRDRPAWFFKHCVKIVSKEKGLVPLDLGYGKFERAQKYIAKRVFDQWFRRRFVRTVDVKARQVGRTTIQKGFELYVSLYNPRSLEITIADDSPGAEDILGMLHNMVEELPAWIRPNLGRSALSVLQFDGFDRRIAAQGHGRASVERDPLGRACKSKFQVETAFNLRAGRKWTPSMLHATEVAFWERQPAKVLLGLRQGVPDVPGTAICLESTANGHGGAFYAEVLAAQTFGSSYELLFVPWFGVGEYAIGQDDAVGRLCQVFRDVDDLEKMRSALETGDLSRFPFDQEELELVDLVRQSEDFGPTITAEQLAWRRWAIVNKAAGDLDTFHQEYPATVAQAFIASGASVFAASGLLWQRRTCERPPIVRGELDWEVGAAGGRKVVFREGVGGRVLLWAWPDLRHEYILAGDYAEGTYQYEMEDQEGRRSVRLRRDNTSLLVGDRNVREIVAECTGRIPPVEAAEMAYMLVLYFNRAWLAPENNAGWAVPTIRLARQMGYERVWMAKTYDQSGADQTFKFGWNTNPATRPVMFATARAALFTRRWKIPSKLVLDELSGMVYRGLPSGKNKEEAKPGEHDDRACAFAILVEVDLELGEMAAALEGAVAAGTEAGRPDAGYWRRVYKNDAERAVVSGGSDGGFSESV